jgi:hypothetical protein
MSKFVEKWFLEISIIIPVLLILTFGCLAIYKKELEIFNRGGALLAAFGSTLVAFQISREIDFDEEKTKIEKQRRDIVDGDPIAAVVNRQYSNRIARNTTERKRIVFVVVLIITSGEIIHGWGDVLLKIVDG